MSERLNSVDIEDVLSSIRRLVSDDKRPVTPAQPPAPAAVPDPQADKLILTPALRIAPEPEPERALASEPEAPAAPPPPAEGEAPIAFQSIRAERRVEPGSARLDAVMGEVARGGLDAGQGEWEAPAEPPSHFASDWAETPAEAAPADMVEAPFADLIAEPEMEADRHAAWQDERDAGERLGMDASADHSPRPGEVDYLRGAEVADISAADAAEEVMAVAPDSTDFAADRLPDAWPTPDWPAPDWATSTPAASVTDVDAWAASQPEPKAPVAMAEEAAMIDKDDPADPVPMPAVEEAVPDWARMEADPAPEPAAADPRWADAAEAEIRRELEEEVTASAFARFADDDLDDRPLDEDMLRDLVRDIIREELQGALGERITRNVRKLVRAEIARALAVRDFE